MERTLLRLDENDFRLLHPCMQRASAKAGQTVVKEGAPPLGLFVIRRGQVHVQRTPAGFPVTITTLDKHAMFGERAFLTPDPCPASASVVAAEDSEFTLLRPARLAPLFDQHPALSARFFHSIALMLSRRLRAYNEQVSGLRRDKFGELPDWEII